MDYMTVPTRLLNIFLILVVRLFVNDRPHESVTSGWIGHFEPFGFVHQPLFKFIIQILVNINPRTGGTLLTAQPNIRSRDTLCRAI
jgi:hypothetical protein